MRKNYSLVQVALAVRNMLDERHGDLVGSEAGKYYEPKLAVQRAEIDALPPALTGGIPLADDLAKADADHDGYGGALYYTVEAVQRAPGVTAEVKAAAERVRDAFVPALAELQDTYALQAHRAAERRPLLEERKADLEMFPVVGGGTLLEVATKLIDAGDTLDALLDQRGSVPKTDRSRAAVLRAKTVGLLNRLRDDLQEEVAKDASLPRDLEHRVFGYLDTLTAMDGSDPKKPADPAPADPARE